MHFVLKIIIFLFLICLLIVPVGLRNKSSFAVKADTLNKVTRWTFAPKVHVNDSIKILQGTFLGNSKRNYYGNIAPEKLDLIWMKSLGHGLSLMHKKAGLQEKYGAGWTGQPLIVSEKGTTYLIQGCYDHKLKKINSKTGETIWEYEFDDILKATGTIYYNSTAKNDTSRWIILQGSRLGNHVEFSQENIFSYRAISYISGKELWRLNSKQTPCYSRDVDGSAIILNDTAYIGLENAYFTVFNPKPAAAILHKNYFTPEIIQEIKLWEENDIQKHGGNLVVESSPCFLNNHVYITCGSGHVYGFNLQTKKLDWDFYIGSDLNGTPPVTADSCIIVTVEREYIAGLGGVYKLDPSKKPEDAVIWYFPTKNRQVAEWLGGIVGSASINDAYNKEQYKPIVAINGIDGFLYVVSQTELGPKVKDHNNIKEIDSPKLLYKYEIGPSISTPIIVGNKIIAAGYDGIYLFSFDEQMHFKLLDNVKGGYEATPTVCDKKIFIASRDGNLYCFGEQENEGTSFVAKENLHKKTLSGKKPILADNSPVYKQKIESIEIKTESGKMYYLIAGSFQIKENAQNLLRQIKSKGYAPVMFAKYDKFYVSIMHNKSKDDLRKEALNVNIPEIKGLWVMEK